MASVKIDSELMTNYLAAQPVPAGSRFVTCLDPQSRRPMVFGISNDPVPKLNVVKVFSWAIGLSPSSRTTRSHLSRKMAMVSLAF